MKKIAAVVTVLIIMIFLFSNPITASAEESGKQQQVDAEAKTYEELREEVIKETWKTTVTHERLPNQSAYELCKSAETWEEYKEIFKDYKCDRGDFLGSELKELPEKIEGLSSLMGGGVYGGIEDAELERFAGAMFHAISLYNKSGIGHLKFSLEMGDLEGPYAYLDLNIEEISITHIGNVVKCYKVPYYPDFDSWREGKNANYYEKQIVCYTCGVAYFNKNGILEKEDYIPFDEVANLKDAQKPKIDRDFDGNILILLCTTDSILGWTHIYGLAQYEDAFGNMEFYNPEYIRYKE